MLSLKKFMGNVFPPAGALLLLLSAVWTVGEFREGSGGNGEAGERAERSAWPERESSTTSEVWLERARAATREVFPPDRERAVEAYGRALSRDPMNSVAWYELARELALLGESERAAAALRRSDELDPQNVKERLGAIQLWDALGETEQAVALARRSASHGGRHLERAARRLVALGIAPVEVYEALNFEALSEDERADHLGALHVNDAAAMRRVVGKLAFERMERAESRADLARLVSRPVLYEEALELWRLEEPELEQVGGGIPRLNLSLERSPFHKSFYFGWQAVEGDSATQVRWIAPNAEQGMREGRIQIRRPAGSEERFRAVIYRTPVPAERGLRFVLNVRSYPPEAAENTLQLALDGVVVDWARLPMGSEGWRRVAVEMPPLDVAVLCELFFEIRPEAERPGRGGAVEVNLGRLEIQEGGGALSPAGGGQHAELQG